MLSFMPNLCRPLRMKLSHFKVFNTLDWNLENGTGVYLFLGLRVYFHQIVAASFSYLSLWHSLIFTHLTDFFDPQRLLPGKVII